MHKFVAPLAAAAIFFGAAPAPVSAQDVRTVKVVLAGLDLSTPAGRTALNRRIASATERVCGSYASAQPHQMSDIDACRAGVRRQVLAQRAALQPKLGVAAR